MLDYRVLITQHGKDYKNTMRFTLFLNFRVSSPKLKRMSDC